MDPLIITLRFLHIGGAVAWVGGIFFFLAVMDPLLRRLPPADAGALGRHLQLRTKMHLFIPVTALLTVGAGIWLSFLVGADKFAGAGGMVFNIGSAAGILTLVPGIAAGVVSARMRKDARAFEAKPDPALGLAMGRRARRISMLTKIAAGFMAVALFCMSTFQYWV